MLIDFINFLVFYFWSSFFNTVVNCDHVPMVMWNFKGSSTPMRPVSAFERDNDKMTKELLESLLKDGSTSMLVYVTDKLSMEDLTPDSYKDIIGNPLKTLKEVMEEPSTIFPSVKDPMKHFRDLDCGIKDIHLGKHNSENLDKTIAGALENFCVVIVHSPNKGLPNGKKAAYKTSKTNVVGVFTSSKSSWHPDEELHRRTRSLLQSEDVNFINETECGIIMYTNGLSIKIGSDSSETPNAQNTSLVLPPTNIKGTCGENDTKTLTLEFDAESKAVIDKATFKMSFKKQSGSWTMENVSLKMEGSKAPKDEVQLKVKDASVPTTFSFSCSEFKLKNKNSSDNEVELTVNRFQIQPFDVRDAFERSFDCVPVFTLPIWMGIMVTLLFIIILNMGVFALFEIKTMDRFDDPKGKTITVPVGTE